MTSNEIPGLGWLQPGSMKIDDPHQSTRLAGGNLMQDNLLADLMRQGKRQNQNESAV